MTFAPRTRYALVTGAVCLASVIQLVRGYPAMIVGAGAATFLLIGNLTVYLSNGKERATRRQRERDYWAQ